MTVIIGRGKRNRFSIEISGDIYHRHRQMVANIIKTRLGLIQDG